ncbi:MAG: ABC transporter permease [Christensenellales bacterium]|jgi:putative aldouronate transport system permease protein
MIKAEVAFEKRAGLLQVLKRIKRDIWVYALLVPGLVYYIVFKYLPMWGVSIAFMDYNPFLGISGSKWVGLKHFIDFFGSYQIKQLFRNTVFLATYNLCLSFPAPILLALMLNEVFNEKFKKIVQTMIYLPHFISWVVVVGLCHVIFSPENGIVNMFLTRMGMNKVYWLTSESAFRLFYTAQGIWKGVGWGTIVYLAALAAIDVEMCEASYIDGANRFQRIWYITLPSIRPTIIILLILKVGDFLDTGFEHIYLMTNSLNREVAQVFDTYVYEKGLLNGSYSYSTAVGLFKSIFGLILVFIADRLAKRAGNDGIY